MSDLAKQFVKNVIENKMFDAKQNFTTMVNQKIASEVAQTRKEVAKNLLRKAQ
jgi:hypothetical protein